MKRLLLILCLLGFPEICGAQCSTVLCPQPARQQHQCSQPTLTIDHHPSSPATQRLVSALRANPEFKAWLHSHYCVHWRPVWWATDLPRFHRQGRPTLFGFTGHEDLQRALVPPRVPAAAVPITAVSEQDWVTHPELTEALGNLGDEFDGVTDDLTTRVEQTEQQLQEGIEHLHSEQQSLQEQFSGVLITQTALEKSSQAHSETLQQVTNTNEQHTSLIERLHDRVETIGNSRVVQTGFNLMQLLAAAGIFSGTGLAGWGALTVIRRVWRWKFPGKSQAVAAGSCPLCPQKDAEIARLRDLVNRRPLNTNATTCTACLERQARIEELEADNRALTIQVEEYRNQPHPTERIIRVPDDAESRVRRAMEMLRREYPTTPNYQTYTGLFWKHYDLLKSGDGIPNV